MNPAMRMTGVGDRAAQRNQRQYTRKLHLQRLQSVKSSIDTRPPKQHLHLQKNLKKKQLVEEKFARIEHENQLLLQKMSSIMNSSTLDNKNQSLQYARSMNKQVRKQNLEKITRENQAILERIQAKEPVYSQVKWEQERQQQEQYLHNISAAEALAARQRPAVPIRLEPMDEDYQREAREFLDDKVNEDDHVFMR
jgi:hypothetical protein